MLEWYQCFIYLFIYAEKVLTVKLGQYQLESMSEWYQCFISANTICS